MNTPSLANLKKLYAITFFCLLTSMYLVGLTHPGLVLAAKATTYLATLSIIALAVISKPKLISIGRGGFFLTFSLLAAWAIIRGEEYYGLIVAVQIIGIALTSAALADLKTEIKQVFLTQLNASLFIFLALSTTHLVTGDVFLNNNFWGAYCLIFSISALRLERFKITFFSIFFIFLIISGTRSALLGIIAGATIIAFAKSNTSFKILFSLSLLSLSIILHQTEVFDYLFSDDFSSVVIQHTGKRFESGRLEIWSAILSIMDGWDWIIGIGGGFNLSGIIMSELSAHSGYISTLSSYGVIGLSLLLILIVYSASNCYKKNQYISFVLIISLAVREFFETSLLNNNFPMAVFFWGILSSGLIDSMTNRKINHQQHKPSQNIAKNSAITGAPRLIR